MRTASLIWASALVASSIALAFLSFFTLSDIVEGVLLYIAQCLLFAASVAGIPYYIDLMNLRRNERKQTLSDS